MGVGATQVAEQRQPGALGRRLGNCERHSEDGVGAQPGLIRGAVQIEQCLIDQTLVVGGQADDGRGDLVEHRFDSLLNALAAVAGSAVAQLDRFVFAGGGARRNGGTGDGAVDQGDLDLDGRVAAGVEDLAGGDLLDDGHGFLLNQGH